MDDTHIVYVLTNEAMPDYIKVGMTATNISARLAQLYTTGVPVPFECFYAGRVPIEKSVERTIHTAFEKYRVNKNREFFEIEPEAVAAIIRLVAIEDVTPGEHVTETLDDIEAIKKLEKRAERFNFSMVNIPIGALLTLDRQADQTCTVVSNSKVDYGGQPMSLSAAALEALRQAGYDWKAAQGAAHWTYQGRTLKDIRQELEARE